MTKFESYHYAWLGAHPERSATWLSQKLKEGFHIHHVDGDHYNDDPMNLILIDGLDHMMLHTGRLKDGIKKWRISVGKRGRAAAMKKREAKMVEASASVVAAPPVVTPGNGQVIPLAAKRAADEVIRAGGSKIDAVRLVSENFDVTWSLAKKRLFR